MSNLDDNLFSSIPNAILVDCDVEEPNDHLFLNYELSKHSDVEISRPVIDSLLCSMCGTCVEKCRFNALVEMIDTIYVAEDLCKGCGLCTMVCPSGAISEIKKPIGEISIGTNAFQEEVFYQGELHIGQSMASPIIKELIRNIPRNGEKSVILDSPPGTACPVISTLSTADYIILVTEPTPYSLENLKQTVEMVKQLGISMGIILNKSQKQYNSIIYKYVEQENISLLLEIPFDKKIAELHAQGLILADNDSQWKEQFQKVVDQITEFLRQ